MTSTEDGCTPSFIGAAEIGSEFPRHAGLRRCEKYVFFLCALICFFMRWPTSNRSVLETSLKRYVLGVFHLEKCSVRGFCQVLIFVVINLLIVQLHLDKSTSIHPFPSRLHKWESSTCAYFDRCFCPKEEVTFLPGVQPPSPAF